MKTVQQVLGFVQGWQKAIRCDDKEINDEGLILQALIAIENYILED